MRILNQVKTLALSSLLLASLSIAEDKLMMSEADKAMYEAMLENNPAEVFVAEGEEYLYDYLDGEEGLAEFLEIDESKLYSYLAGFPRYVEKVGKVIAIDQLAQAVMVSKGETPFKLESEEMNALNAYIKSLANGEKVNIDVNANEHMKEMYILGKEVFETRRGGRGLSCYSCHSDDIVGSRLRMQALPDLGAPKTKASATWPAYRMTKSKLTSLQKRFQQCMNNALLAKIPVGSREMVALEVYITNMSKGYEVNIPGLKR